jgi:hypothetical protein
LEPAQSVGVPRAAILDGAHGAGNAHFFFLEPIVPAPSFSGPFDAAQAPVVQVCELTSSGGCRVPLVAEFTMTGGTGSERVRVDPAEEHYIVNWHTALFGLDVSKAYRILVLVNSLELGHADVDVVASGRDQRAMNGAAFVAVVDGRTLPIKFRIEDGAVTCAPLVTLDANNFVLSQNAGRLPPVSGAGQGFFMGSRVLFAAGFSYGTSGDDLILGLDTRGVIEDLDLTSPVCLTERGPDQETFGRVRPRSGVSGPPGLTVTQRSFAFGAPPNDDYILLLYTVRNEGMAPVANLFSGYVLDWDVFFSPTFTDEIAQFNPLLQIGEVVERNGALHPQVVGVLPISAAPVHYAGFRSPGCQQCPPPSDPADHAGWFDLLSGGVQSIRIGPGVDVRQLVGIGPSTLGAGESRVYAFALVGGSNRADFEANVQAARAKADGLGFGAPVTYAPFLGSVSNTSLDFGEPLVVEPAASLPWDGDEFVAFGSTSPSFVLQSSADAITVIVPRLPIGPSKLFVFQQGSEQRFEGLDVNVVSTFTPVGLDQFAAAPDISGGPFPMSFFIELSNEEPDHILTVAPSANLPLTVQLEWQTSADLDILWMNQEGSDFAGNFDGATLANPEHSSVTVPAGETWRLRFNKFDTTRPPSLARVTITSP